MCLFSAKSFCASKHIAFGGKMFNHIFVGVDGIGSTTF